MTLISCPDCKKQVSDEATKCPICGCPISEKKIPISKKGDIVEVIKPEEAEVPKKKLLVEWSDQYNLGIAEVDLQHQSIADLINEIFETVNQGNCKGDYKLEVLKKLKLYITEHFSYEENYLKLENILNMKSIRPNTKSLFLK